ncbi:Tudor domain-containing protein 7 [Trichinella pseudospiralis]|uniref:Tudor domain-containing protein 7 n=1 Tax=Trichinella pseudospiralis TaxID=6337 RepID=A0A0V0Y5K1_TRIPS|nr:Tudor domain-containing protein 7 [Trichinella pseudospiralis]
MDFSTLAKKVHSILMSFKNGAMEKEFKNEFKALTGVELPLRQHGFTTVEELLGAMPELVQIKCNNRGEKLYVGVATAATADLKSLISKQRGNDNYKLNEFRYEVKNTPMKMTSRVQTNVKLVEGRLKQNFSPNNNPAKQTAGSPVHSQMTAPKMTQKSNCGEMTMILAQPTRTQAVLPKPIVPVKKEDSRIFVQPKAAPVEKESSNDSTYINIYFIYLFIYYSFIQLLVIMFVLVEVLKKEKIQQKSVEPYVIQLYGSVKLPYQFQSIVCYVESPYLFYVCSVGIKNLFYDDLACKMADDFKISPTLSENDIIPGRMYMVLNDVSAMGYSHYIHRGLCLEKPKDGFITFQLIDFGSIVSAKLKLVRMLNYSYINISPMVMACTLYGMKNDNPNDNAEYSEPAMQYFKSVLLNNYFTIIVKKKTTFKNKLGMDVQLLCVDLRNSTTGVTVIENLLEKRISVM